MSHETYRFSMRTMTWMDEQEHRHEIDLAVRGLRPDEIERFRRDTIKRRAKMLAHYEDEGPDFDDCDPLMHLAEAKCARLNGDHDHAAYSERMAEYVSELLRSASKWGNDRDHVH